MVTVTSNALSGRARVVRVAAAGALAAAGVIAVVASASPAGARSPEPEHVTPPTAVALHITSVKQLGRGDVVVSATTSDGTIVRGAGVKGSRLTATRIYVDGHAGLSVGMIAPSGASGTVKAYRHSKVSVYSQAIAVGASRTQAARMASALRGKSPNAKAATFNSSCAYQNDKYVDASACVVQAYLQNVPGQVYVSNKITCSGSGKTSNLDYLSGFYEYNNGFTYTRVGWSPSATHHEGSPTTYTLTANGGGFGASIQEDQYPDILEPNYIKGMNEAAFGSSWEGGNEDYNSANSVAIVHNGHGSPSDTNVFVNAARGN